MADRPTLRAGTRKSRLALWQTGEVGRRLQHLQPDIAFEQITFTTFGDRVTDAPLSRLGAKGIFTRELEDALRNGAIDLAVHSLKDLPTTLPDGLMVGAVLERADPRDVLIASPSMTLAALPRGARVGTSSLRRRAQLLALRPDLEMSDLRGNVPTRIDRVTGGTLDAAVLASAGVSRLGLERHVAETLDPSVMLPAPGQGALAIEIRQSDDRTAQLIGALNHRPTALAVIAERALLGELEGGCQVPVGALASFVDADRLRLHALVIDLDGREGVRDVAEAAVSSETDAKALGVALANRLRQAGAGAILARVRGAIEHPAEVPES